MNLKDVINWKLISIIRKVIDKECSIEQSSPVSRALQKYKTDIIKAIIESDDLQDSFEAFCNDVTWLAREQAERLMQEQD